MKNSQSPFSDEPMKLMYDENGKPYWHCEESGHNFLYFPDN